MPNVTGCCDATVVVETDRLELNMRDRGERRIIGIVWVFQRKWCEKEQTCYLSNGIRIRAGGVTTGAAKNLGREFDGPADDVCSALKKSLSVSRITTWKNPGL